MFWTALLGALGALSQQGGGADALTYILAPAAGLYVADIDGHAASQLDPHFEPRDGRASVSLQRAYPASQLDAVAEPPGLPRGGPSGLEPQGSPRGVPAGGGLLGSQLDPTSEPQGHARNVAIGGGDLSSHLDSDFESLGNPRDVPEGSVSPASQGLKPLLEPQGDRREKRCQLTLPLPPTERSQAQRKAEQNQGVTEKRMGSP
ncbi:uncharacterized protein LOC135323858 isoform X3 [Dromaius novaehollandiae]|uniref:uncharacterized protein LOC135323851 isoform X3 n=1 Tax=Dromaius novaehollandiae TaxID=8790 RepID=UPI00311F1CA4